MANRMAGSQRVKTAVSSPTNITLFTQRAMAIVEPQLIPILLQNLSSPLPLLTSCTP